MANWTNLTQRASLCSHQLIGWIFWDPTAKDNLAELGVPNGLGHYITNRAAPLASAGSEAVFAAFYTIKREFIEFSLQHAKPYIKNWTDVTDARDRAVLSGIQRLAPEITVPLGELADELWRTVDALGSSGRVLFAAHKSWPRAVDPVLSAWNALNTIREWRGDTHFALLVADDIGIVEAGLLHDAWMGYPSQWIPRSRGADDADIDTALENLTKQGFVTDGVVDSAGIEYRQKIEEKTDLLSQIVWKTFGEENTLKFLNLIEPVGQRFVEEINKTAGENWMPAARPRRR